MEIIKQVDISHYEFQSYLTLQRWCSIWNQLDLTLKCKPNSVLEIGQGLGIFKNVGNLLGLNIETLDLDPSLKPDYVGSITQLPFSDKKYDLVCAFQVLEHLPYEKALHAFNEMLRVSNDTVIISLPDSRVLWRFQIYIPFFGPLNLFFPRFLRGNIRHEFDGQHYWEINKKGYELRKVISDFSQNAKLIHTYRVTENTYHRFFIFSKLVD